MILPINRQLLQSVSRIIAVPYRKMENMPVSYARLSVQFGEGDVRVDVLVALCNTYRLRIDNFFTQSGTAINREDLCVADNVEFTPYEFKGEILGVDSSVKLSSLVVAMFRENVGLDDVFVGGAEEVEQHTGQYIFNAEMMNMLPTVLNLPMDAIGTKAGRSQTYILRCKKERDTRVRSFVQVCNTFHLDILAFFRPEITEKVIVPDDRWKPIEFHPERLHSFYGASGQPYTHDGFLALIGYDRNKLARHMSDESPMKASDLVYLCNTLSVPPSFFFDSPRMASAKGSMAMMKQMVAQLTEEKKSLEQEVERLRAMLLNDKIDDRGLV